MEDREGRDHGGRKGGGREERREERRHKKLWRTVWQLSLYLNSWDFPGSPVDKTALPMQGTRVQSLVRELWSCMLCSMAKNLKQNKNSCANIYHLINAEFSIERGMKISLCLKSYCLSWEGLPDTIQHTKLTLNLKTNKSFFNIIISQIWHGVYLR